MQPEAASAQRSTGAVPGVSSTLAPWSEDGPPGAATRSAARPSPAGSAQPPNVPGPASPANGARRRSAWERSHASLILLVVAFTVGYFLASWWRFLQFYGENWDLGINMQALWSTTHGLLLYESGDFETGGFRSLLSIHSTYIGLPIAYVYALAPGPEFLFALQAAVVASSAIPLYLIGRKAGLPESWVVAGLGVYLLTFTISSAILYDFHWEAFLPAEFAWTYYLWTQRRYVWALVPAAIGVLTLEVFPFLLVGMVLYFAYPSLRRFVSAPGRTLRAMSGQARSYLRRAWPLVGLFLFAVVAYALVRFAQHDLIPGVVGTTPSSAGSQVSLVFRQLFGVTATSHTLVPSLVYWFLLFAAVGFIPLLARQSLLLLSLPWFWASVFVDPMYSSAFGNQYAFVAMATISVAFVEGLAAVYRYARSAETAAPVPLEWLAVVLPFFVLTVFFSTALLRPTLEGEYLLLIAAAVVGGVLVLIGLSRGRPEGWSRSVWHTTRTLRSPEDGMAFRQSVRFEIRVPRSPSPPRIAGLAQFRPRAGTVVAGVLVIVVLSNFALSPFSPANFDATVFPGYRFSFSSNPAYGYMGDLLAYVPSNAEIVASDNLFPFVANDVNAYSLLFADPTGAPHLPFDAAHLPPYVLLSISGWSAVPNFLRDTIFNQTDYGIVAMIYYPSYPEPIYLFETGYTGTTALFQAAPFPNTMTICPSAFSLGASGRLIAAAGTACGSAIESAPAANLSGNGHTVWFGPYISLLPGSYSVTLSLKGGLDSGKPASTHVVLLDAGAYGTTSPWYSVNLNATALSPKTWTNVTFPLNLSTPVSGAEFRGYIDYSGGSSASSANGFIDLNFVKLTRDGSGA